MRDESLTDKVDKKLRGRANADTMQALTTGPLARQSLTGQGAEDLATGYQGQLGAADKAAEEIRNQKQTPEYLYCKQLISKKRLQRQVLLST